MADVRWKQRFANFEKAFSLLESVISQNDLNDAERAGLRVKYEMNNGLDRDTLSRLVTVFNKFPVLEKVTLFGSRAKGSQRNRDSRKFAVKTECDDMSATEKFFWSDYEKILMFFRPTSTREFAILPKRNLGSIRFLILLNHYMCKSLSYSVLQNIWIEKYSVRSNTLSTYQSSTVSNGV